MIGVVAFGSTVPLTATWPGEKDCASAVAVTVTGAEVVESEGAHVPLYTPPPTLWRETVNVALFENDNCTAAFEIGSPQLSTTVTEAEVGQATVALKPWEMPCVKTGQSAGDWQAGAWRGLSDEADTLPGLTTKRMAT